MYRFTGKTGANSGSFKKVESEDFVTGNTLDYVYSVYPYRESTSITNNGALILELPSEQTYRADSFGIGANTMVSCTEGNELLFKNLCGYLAINLYGDNVSVTSITFKGNNCEKLAGEATVDSSINSLPAFGDRYPYSQAQNRGVDGFYWSSSVVNYFSWSMKVSADGPGKWYMGKAYGLSVRCVRETSPGEVYISSDYSLDGHVNHIQKATKGDGVNLVIIGDAFSDKDQDLFIRYANLAKDAIFSEEPYTRLKDRFNVYAINTVSENDNVNGSTRFLTDFMGGSKIQGDISLIYTFIREKLPQIDLNKAPICLIDNDTRYAGYCNWWTSNEALCFVPLSYDDESFSGTLLHEFGGHAFGKLLDEYNYSGTIPSSTVEDRISWRNLAYGFYANVDYTNDPSAIQGSHFLTDERYSGMVGIYEGAVTSMERIDRPKRALWT